MDTGIEKKFSELGVRVKIRSLPPHEPRWRGTQTSWPRLDILHDRKGEYFDIEVPNDCSIHILDVQPGDRHLLLMARTSEGEKGKFLCGHDERHWFACAVPERNGVRDVATAKRALQPEFVQGKVKEMSLKPKHQNRRRNQAFIRQGEWFFVKAEIEPPANKVLHNESLSRGRQSRPHVVEFLYRHGGTQVYVHHRHAPTGIIAESYRQLRENVRKAAGWTRMVRDPEVYARGHVRHSDHKTIVLKGWHRVLMNTEAQARAAVNVVFLD